MPYRAVVHAVGEHSHENQAQACEDAHPVCNKALLCTSRAYILTFIQLLHAQLRSVRDMVHVRNSAARAAAPQRGEHQSLGRRVTAAWYVCVC